MRPKTKWFIGYENDPEWVWLCSDEYHAFARRDRWNQDLTSQGKVGNVVVYRKVGDLVFICDGKPIENGLFGPFVKDYSERRLYEEP